MCILCAACNNPLRAVLLLASAISLIEWTYLAWLGVFTLSMSFMDHRRDAIADTTN